MANERSAISDEEITEYWNGRSVSYSNSVVGELADSRRDAWRRMIDLHAGPVLTSAEEEGSTPRAVDLGCGPGFFSVLLAECGCSVDAVDMSENMIERAKANVDAASLLERVTFHLHDVSSLPFPDCSFDLAVARNVTWLMREPETAYAEWFRVLRPGGKLLVFDANWYRYLVDPAVDAKRRSDQRINALEWDEDTLATSEECRRCEEIAAALPLTRELRPGWDLELLDGLGACEIHADEGVWKELWTESEQAYYASSPLFLVEASKARM